MHQSPTLYIIIGLVFIGMYRRTRRSIGWQKLQPRRMKVRIWILSVIGLLFLAEGVQHPISLISIALGIAIGILLAYYGAASTRFDPQADGTLLYRSSTWIGAAVTALFIIRIAYRFYSGFGATSPAKQSQNAADAFENASIGSGNYWSAGLMLIVFAYYVLYYILVLRKAKHVGD